MEDEDEDDDNDVFMVDEEELKEGEKSKKKNENRSAKKQTIRIDSTNLNNLKEYLNKKKFPLIQEYDFDRDTKNPNLKIELRPNTMTRDYQEQALAKMFSHGRARSGIIVLPCGAGKTLTGISAACTIRKSTLVVCTTQVSSE